MDEFTRRIFEAAYRAWRNKKKKQSPTVEQLITQAETCWVDYRDALITEWADQLNPALASAAPQRLAGAAEVLLDRLYRYQLYWEVPDEDYLVEWVAHAVASLRWILLEITDKVPLLHFERAEIEAFLKERSFV